MKRTSKHIILLTLLLSSIFADGQINILRKQIHELKEHRNFITESACPQREDVLKQYQTNFDKLMEVLDIAVLVYRTPLSISKEHIKEEAEKYITYPSSNLTNVLVKRYGTKTSLAGLVSDNSSIPVGTKLLTETFTLNNTEVEVRYIIGKTSTKLINIEAVYTDKTRVFIDIDNLPQGLIGVYNTNEYGSEFKNLFVLFSNEIGQLNFIQTTGYELRPQEYTEMITANQGLVKYRYASYCYDEKDNPITPSQKGKELTIKPTNHLLWYKGSIGKYPIHLMLKRGFVKENEYVEINDTIISNVRYAYDSQKKWIDLENRWERQAGIFAFEGEQDDTPEWFVEFSKNSQYGKELTGDWDNQNGTILPIKLTPMLKEFPNFTFKVEVENEILPNGKVGNQSITALNIYQKNKKIQQINLSDSKPDLEYFEVSYVDINYDGYLDLIVDNSFLLYNAKTKKFESSTNEDGDGWDYIPNLKEIDSYNPYTKSFTVQQRRYSTEYRAVNGKLTPFTSEYYYPDENGNMVYVKQKYVNGKWKEIEKSVDNMEEEENQFEDPINDDIDISSPKNYTLNVDLSVRDRTLGFAPSFYNKTGLKITFKEEAKLYVEVTSTNNKTFRKFLHNVPLRGEKGENYLDDNFIVLNNNIYFYENAEELTPFFPPNLNNGDYIFQLVLEHPLFGEVKSQKQQIKLPLDIKKDKNLQHFKGTIGKNVKGSIYFFTNENEVVGTFINAKTGKSIKLKGSYVSGFFGSDTLNLEEYEKDDKLSGYFEGKISTLKGEKEYVYEGFWISPNKEVRVPFVLKKQK